jgi:tRNA(Ile)-lysidine synthase
LLKSNNRQIAEALLRTARIAGDDLAFLDGEVSRIWDSLARWRGNTIALDKAGFLGLSPAIQRHLLRTSIEKLWGLKDIEARHIEEIMVSLTKPAGKRLSLPGGLVFSIEYDRYLLASDEAALSPFPSLVGEFPLVLPGETLLSSWRITAATISREQMAEKGKFEGTKPLQSLQFPLSKSGEGDKGGEVGKQSYEAYFDLDKTGNKLTVRTRQPGDRFQPLGMNQPKKLGEFMIDAKIPRAWRERVPLVCSPGQILWVVGWRIDERAKVTEQTEKVLCLEFERSR